MAAAQEVDEIADLIRAEKIGGAAGQRRTGAGRGGEDYV